MTQNGSDFEVRSLLVSLSQRTLNSTVEVGSANELLEVVDTMEALGFHPPPPATPLSFCIFTMFNRLHFND